ncbi:MAG: hypothetical protein ACSHXK_05750 [Oceanococcus sp.]
MTNKKKVMISLEDFCQLHNEAPDTVIAKIKSGEYIGQKSRDGWRVPIEQSLPESESKAKSATVKSKKVIQCKQCDEVMVRGTKVERNMGLQVLGVFLFILAIVLLFLFPIGTILGVLLMLIASRLGYGKKKVWKCKGCGYFFEIA